MIKKYKKKICLLSLLFSGVFLCLTLIFAHPVNVQATGNGESSSEDVADSADDINDGLSITYRNESGEVAGTVKILLTLTILSLAPSILVMLTSFTRIVVVLHFVRQALGTQTAPPNQVLIGLSLFLTFFIMSPVFSQINETAIKPFDAGEITQEQAIELAQAPIREFMYKETQAKDLALFCDIAEVSFPETEEDYDNLAMTIVIPSFIISELRTAFIIGFLIYIPFIVLDMVVSSVLMSMGMMMLPPTTISMPFKILLFVLADGWNLVIGNLVKTFY